jgi:hypothetical protein
LSFAQSSAVYSIFTLDSNMQGRVRGYLHARYPDIEPSRFCNFVAFSVSNGQIVVSCTDRTTIRTFSVKNAEGSSFCKIFTAWYDLRLQRDGELMEVSERHLTEEEIKQQQKQALRYLGDGPELTLPKSRVADSWN